MARSNEHLTVAFIKILRGAALLEHLGAEAAWDRVRECMALIREQTAANGGREIKTITGDTAMCSYPAAQQALQAATAIVEQLPERLGDDVAAEMPVAIGFAHGPVLLEEGDAFGHTVHIAARLASEAKGSQILTNRESAESLPDRLRALARHIDNMPVKGISDPIEVFEVLWEDEAATHLVVPVRREDTVMPLHLACGSATLIVDAANAPVVLGRGSGADFRVAEPDASRLHARIEHRRGKYVLTDDSVNGTWVQSGDGVTRLRRGENCTLAGEGRIFLGRDPDSATQVVEFVQRD